MITFKLNGKTVQGEEGQYILQVAEKFGVDIPTLCHHKALEPAGMCRLCTVELFDGRRKRYVTSCNYPIWEGMEINTDSEAVHQGRKLIVELLLARCPEVPLLQKLAAEYGIEEPRFEKENDTCILCGLCVRACEKMGANAISLTGRGVDMMPAVLAPRYVPPDTSPWIPLEQMSPNASLNPSPPNMKWACPAASRSMCPMPRRSPTRRSLTATPVFISKPAVAKFAPPFAASMPSIITCRMKSSS